MTAFRVQQIDHVELFVPDQHVAAAWYEHVFGLTIVPEFAHWAADGPLMISSDNGSTMLALFRGEPRGTRPTAGHHRVAFRVSAAQFLAFQRHIAAYPVYNEHGATVTTLPIIDHDCAWSVYFCDPYGNRYEVTSYDYGEIAAHLQRS